MRNPQDDLATRMFNRKWFAAAWVMFLAVVVTRFWWVRDVAMVWLVYGRDAYIRDGVRVLPGKPIRFSTGALAPIWTDMATGFGFFFIVVFGLSLALIVGLRFYDRFRKTRNAA